MTRDDQRRPPRRKSPDSTKSPPPSLAEWRALYAAANHIASLAPWTWMQETDVFAVEDPDTGDIGFVSVTGSLGEHLSVTVYRGVRALYQFLELQRQDPVDMRDAAESILEIPQLQASFEDRKVLQLLDLVTIKSLKLRYRGAKGWPMFRSYVPGYTPWIITPAEARFLTHVLEQVPAVAPRFIENPGLIDVDDPEKFLLRAAGRQGDALVWGESIIRVPPPPSAPISIALPAATVDALSEMPRDGEPVEADFFLVPASIGPETERRPYIYMLLLVGSRSGMVVGHDVLTATPTLDVMLGEVAGHVARSLTECSSLPSVIRVPSERLYDLLRPLALKLDVPLEIESELRALDEARAALKHMLSQR